MLGEQKGLIIGVVPHAGVEEGGEGENVVQLVMMLEDERGFTTVSLYGARVFRERLSRRL